MMVDWCMKELGQGDQPYNCSQSNSCLKPQFHIESHWSKFKQSQQQEHLHVLSEPDKNQDIPTKPYVIASIIYVTNVLFNYLIGLLPCIQDHFTDWILSHT